ncbi:trypsin-like serine protease [Variovorax guangxiensis]|uniref:Trypsin-like serine protease n=1 Tax=Variovorax guangxiensis TaxID=1775474 RepID=A0A433MVJ6_9BURK|nr:trypsin-like serine protease [Variovorax guangxiensis]RUR71911.1 trypsin-like serine protease [Variovorax guangxiensis]
MLRIGGAFLIGGLVVQGAIAQQNADLGAVRTRRSDVALRYEELGKITDRLPTEGLTFRSIAPDTWGKLSDAQRKAASRAIRQLDRSEGLTAAQKSQVWGQIVIKADMTAAHNLTKSRSRQKLGASYSMPQDGLVGKDWIELLQDPRDRELTLSEASKLITYHATREFSPQALQNSDPDRVGMIKSYKEPDGSRGMGYPGSPAPALPGKTKPTTEEMMGWKLIRAGASDCFNPVNEYRPDCMVQSKEVANAVKGLPDRQEEQFNPLGFMEVVKIRRRQGGLACTGTLIKQDLVLTAKHCVEKYQASDLYVMAPKEDEAELATCRQKLMTTGVYRQCVAFEDYELASQSPVRMHDKADVALMKLSRAAPNPIAKVSLASKPDLSRISMAGYGENGGQRTFESENAIEVGWFNGTPKSHGWWMEWTFDPEKKNSAPCAGDSGGPVYRGRHVGYDKDRVPREIVSIVTEADRLECKDHRTLQTMLSYASIKKWLCDDADFPSGMGSGCEARIGNVASLPIKSPMKLENGLGPSPRGVERGLGAGGER